MAFTPRRALLLSIVKYSKPGTLKAHYELTKGSLKAHYERTIGALKANYEHTGMSGMIRLTGAGFAWTRAKGPGSLKWPIGS